MAKRTNEDLLSDILQNVGGIDNIRSATNCMTRMRIRLKDDSKINQKELENVEGVMGVVEAETLQIVVGPGTARKLTEMLVTEYKIPEDSEKPSEVEDWRETKQDIKDRQSKGRGKKALETIANIFIPMIPAIIAAGLFQGFSSLIGTMLGEGTIDGAFWEVVQTFFALIGNSFLGYFAVFTGVNAAKEFKATEALGGMIGAMSIAAPLIDLSTQFGLYDADEPLNSILTTGKGGIIGVIIGVWILAQIEKFVRKRVPDVLDIMLSPVITLLIAGLIMVFIVMPVSGVLSDWLVSFLSIFIGLVIFFDIIAEKM